MRRSARSLLTKAIAFTALSFILIMVIKWRNPSWSISRPTSRKTWTSTESKPSVLPSDWIDTDAEDSTRWNSDELFKRNIPRYVLDHAPLIYLYPDEPYWIADPAEFLKHVKPFRNGSQVEASVSLANLAELDRESGTVYLVSNDDVDDQPPWMVSSWNVPLDHPLDTVSSSNVPTFKATEEARNKGWLSASPVAFPDVPPPGFEATDWSLFLANPANNTPGFSTAPGVMITVAKENGVLDAFWFIFNAFNLGNKVLGRRYGHHVGDWEHVMIRFQHGEPKALYTSRHSFGDSVYAWDALQKHGLRPVVYSARGSHAMYVTSGVQPYKAPFGLLADDTGTGPLWDPALPGLKAFTYDAVNDQIRASSLSPKAPTSWLHFRGRWGDPSTSWTDSRLYRPGFLHRYNNGPTGPKFKNLGRELPCESMKGGCEIRTSLVP